jgi:hypothetical protein
MTNLKNLEIINLSTIDGKLVATLSYQNPEDILSVNNGYDTIEVPVNIREYQLSVRGNRLVDQSIQNFAAESPQPKQDEITFGDLRDVDVDSYMQGYNRAVKGQELQHKQPKNN